YVSKTATAEPAEQHGLLRDELPIARPYPGQRGRPADRRFGTIGSSVVAEPIAAQMFGTSYYKRSPVWVQECMIAARAWARGALREGHAFREDALEIGRSQWLDGPSLGAL